MLYVIENILHVLRKARQLKKWLGHSKENMSMTQTVKNIRKAKLKAA